MFVHVYSKSQRRRYNDDGEGGAAWNRHKGATGRHKAQVVRYADDGEPVSTEITNENYKTISLEKCQQQPLPQISKQQQQQPQQQRRQIRNVKGKNS